MKENKYADPSLRVNKSYLKKARIEFINRVIFYLIPTAQKRVSWLQKKGKFALLGEHIHYQPRKYPTGGQRVKLHDNVAIAADVEFTEHDIIHWIFNGIEGKSIYSEYRGCIEIHENVFVGAGTRILADVSIGPNVIIAAGSLVNKDIKPGTVVAGVPAKVIGDFDSFMQKRRDYSLSHPIPGLSNDEYWDEFYKNHKKEL